MDTLCLHVDFIYQHQQVEYGNMALYIYNIDDKRGVHNTRCLMCLFSGFNGHP